jgi:hypothetical protein
MAHTNEQLAEFAAKAAELRTEAHKLEAEQETLNEYGSAEGDRHWMLGTKIKQLREEADRVYAPVPDAIEDDIRNGP